MSAVKKLETSASLLQSNSYEWIAKEVESSALTTFLTMLRMQVKAGPHRLEMKNPVQGDISGIINAGYGDKCLSMIVSFPKQTILFVMEKLLQEPFKDVDARVQDAVGEFTNIIYGTLKSNLSRQGYNLGMSIPHVVIGEQHLIWGHKCESVMMLPMKMEGHEFFVILAVHSFKEPPKK